MTEVADIYIGNIERDNLLARQVASAKQQGTILEVTLQNSDRNKGRILTHSNCGVAIGIIKSRDFKLQEGDVFQTKQKQLLLVHLAAETLMVLSFADPIDAESTIELVRLGHLLGNQHYPIQIKERKIYVRLKNDTRVIQNAIEKLKIPNLTITWEKGDFLEEITITSDSHHH